jgi:hypothetical protein
MGVCVCTGVGVCGYVCVGVCVTQQKWRLIEGSVWDVPIYLRYMSLINCRLYWENVMYLSVGVLLIYLQREKCYQEKDRNLISH